LLSRGGTRFLGFGYEKKKKIGVKSIFVGIFFIKIKNKKIVDF
jgi:hypothetical protein